MLRHWVQACPTTVGAVAPKISCLRMFGNLLPGLNAELQGLVTLRSAHLAMTAQSACVGQIWPMARPWKRAAASPRWF